MKCRMLLSALIVCCTLPLTACDGKNETSSEANRTQIADGKASIVLPEGYIKMSDELLAQKYPDANRPKEAWYVEKENGKVTIAFNMTKNPIKESQLPEFADVMKNNLVTFSPEVISVAINGKRMQRIQVTTPDAANPNGGIYNIMQFASVDGKLMIATFNTTTELKDKYGSAGLESLSSIQY
ncbi:hypothetical protein ACMYSL_05240 [Klebsiella sp. MISC125]|uniref:hypothetical protein n=1 Tax=Klebsiella sp. MISC125 TaxID=2755386 RepID=UPI003DAA4A86